MAAEPKTFGDKKEACQAMLVMIDVMSANSSGLIDAIKDKPDQQAKIAAVMPKMQALLSPEMAKLGFPPGPMGLMMGFAAFKKAAKQFWPEDEAGCVIQRGKDAGIEKLPGLTMRRREHRGLRALPTNENLSASLNRVCLCVAPQLSTCCKVR